MGLNGAMLEREPAVFVAIIKLMRYCTGTVANDGKCVLSWKST